MKSIANHIQTHADALNLRSKRNEILASNIVNSATPNFKARDIDFNKALQARMGTEILMQDFENPGDHGLVRTDFPGGWKGDKVNAFSGTGLNEDQKDMQQYLKTILNFRKKSKVIHEGETVHFAPLSGVYLLFRKIENDIVFLILNKNKKPVTIDLRRFKELDFIGKKFQNILSNETFLWQETLKLNKEGSYIFSSITE